MGEKGLRTRSGVGEALSRRKASVRHTELSHRALQKDDSIGICFGKRSSMRAFM